MKKSNSPFAAWRGIRRRLWVALLGVLLAGFANIVGAGVVVCAGPGEQVSLRVSFAASFENAVVVAAEPSGRSIIGFNNFFGRGAGGEWRRGAGDWQTPPLSERRCFRIDGLHKAGVANPGLPWVQSACRVGGLRIGFEDGEDMDYQDARVDVLSGNIESIDPPCSSAPPRAAMAKKHAMPPKADAAPPPAAAAPARPRLETEKREQVMKRDEAAKAVERARRQGDGEMARAPAGLPKQTLSFKLPEFPFPPPDPSGRLRIPRELLTGAAAAPTFGLVATRLENALLRNGYAELSYFAVPEGFTVVTQLERINPDATPAAEQRWNIAVAPVSLKSFSLDAYVRALLQKDAGYFRVIAFVFTSEPFVASGKKVPVDEAMKWVDKGANTLPHDVAARPYGEDMVATALVYEFEVHTHGANAQLRKPSPHDGAEHLRASGILRALGEGR